MFEHILFAHNEEEIRSTFYEIFTDLGYKITTALKHQDILELLRKERPDYIILDPDISDIPAEIASEKIGIIDDNIKVIILDRSQNKLQMIQDIIKILRENRPTLLSQKKSEDLHLKVNILVVDDEKECAESIKIYLSKKGYKVNAALSGEEAILKIKADKPNIVFLDIRLPGMDGIIVLKTIKNMDTSIIVIMTSGIGDEEIIREALNLGADGYLVKPFGLSKLEATILSTTLHKSLK